MKLLVFYKLKNDTGTVDIQKVKIYKNPIIIYFYKLYLLVKNLIKNR
jgi:hypothetical protein